jgi:uncharacterized protein with ATP-grasp and redox domains
VLGDLDAVLQILGTTPERRAEIGERARVDLERTWPLNRIPGEHIAEAHRLLKRELGLPHPFERARARANQVGLQLAAEAARRAPSERDPAGRLLHFIRWAIAGNLLDFRVCGYELTAAETQRLLQEKFDEGLALDQTPALGARLRAAREILFVHDNVGEVAFDKELVRELRRQAPQAHVTSALRTGVMTSDATLEDGRAVGLGEVSNVIASGPDTLGICFAEMTPEMHSAIASADLILSKGQANFYVFDDRPAEVRAPVLCLLRTKCMVVSRHLGFDRIVNVAQWIEPA